MGKEKEQERSNLKTRKTLSNAAKTQEDGKRLRFKKITHARTGGADLMKTTPTESSERGAKREAEKRQARRISSSQDHQKIRQETRDDRREFDQIRREISSLQSNCNKIMDNYEKADFFTDAEDEFAITNAKKNIDIAKKIHKKIIAILPKVWDMEKLLSFYDTLMIIAESYTFYTISQMKTMPKSSAQDNLAKARKCYFAIETSYTDYPIGQIGKETDVEESNHQDVDIEKSIQQNTKIKDSIKPGSVFAEFIQKGADAKFYVFKMDYYFTPLAQFYYLEREFNHAIAEEKTPPDIRGQLTNLIQQFNDFLKIINSQYKDKEFQERLLLEPLKELIDKNLTQARTLSTSVRVALSKYASPISKKTNPKSSTPNPQSFLVSSIKRRGTILLNTPPSEDPQLGQEETAEYPEKPFQARDQIKSSPNFLRKTSKESQASKDSKAFAEKLNRLETDHYEFLTQLRTKVFLSITPSDLDLWNNQDFKKQDNSERMMENFLTIGSIVYTQSQYKRFKDLLDQNLDEALAKQEKQAAETDDEESCDAVHGYSP